MKFILSALVAISFLIARPTTAIAQVSKEELKEREKILREKNKASEDERNAANEAAKLRRQAEKQKRDAEAAEEAARKAREKGEEQARRAAQYKKITEYINKGVICDLAGVGFNAGIANAWNSDVKRYSHARIEIYPSDNGTYRATYSELATKLKVRHRLALTNYPGYYDPENTLADVMTAEMETYLEDSKNRENTEVASVNFVVENIKHETYFSYDDTTKPIIHFRGKDFYLTWALNGLYYTDARRDVTLSYHRPVMWLDTPLNRKKVNGVRRQGLDLHANPAWDYSAGFGSAGIYPLIRYIVVGTGLMSYTAECRGLETP